MRCSAAARTATARSWAVLPRPVFASTSSLSRMPLPFPSSSPLRRSFATERKATAAAVPPLSHHLKSTFIPLHDLPPAQAAAARAEVESMVRDREPLRSLPQPFYLSPTLYDTEMRSVWRASWLFAGFAFQVPKPGDYFTYEVGKDSIIIMRGDDGKLRAMFNTCRHRGSRICAAGSGGHVKRLVCPYHQWSYGRDGALLFAREMPENFSKADNGLFPCHLREVGGMLFVCLSPSAPRFDFDPAQTLIGSQIDPHGLEKGKAAYTATYTINANWKLVYENNRECYHCNATHPEYIASNYDTTFSYTTDADGKTVRLLDRRHPRADEVEGHMEERTRHWQSLGFECTPDNQFPGEGWYRASRQPLRKGWSVESLDGTPVSTLMGRLKEADMGSLRIHTLPNFWIHASSDHAVSARLTPLSINQTEVVVTWVVDANAVEGKDYTLEKLLPFWKKTSEQDWQLCSDNQLGVQSSVYVPGVLSPSKEKGVEKFLTWYLSTLVSTTGAKL